MASKSALPAKANVIAFRDAGWLQSATCLLADHARNTLRTTKLIEKKTTLNRNRDASVPSRKFIK